MIQDKNLGISAYRNKRKSFKMLEKYVMQKHENIWKKQKQKKDNAWLWTIIGNLKQYASCFEHPYLWYSRNGIKFYNSNRSKIASLEMF